MPVVQIATAPSRELYEKLATHLSLDDDAPSGLVAHTAAELPSGRVQIVDVFETEADLQSFTEQRLLPAFERSGLTSAAKDNEPPSLHRTFHLVAPR
jgi:hypothetical protein